LHGSDNGAESVTHHVSDSHCDGLPQLPVGSRDRRVEIYMAADTVREDGGAWDHAR
tara:strand:- start:1113 stop:1280 length:168 start_codon:yes stop_codon:yes gene_type:complete